MKFKIKIANKNGFWFENYIKNIDDPEEYGKEIIEYYNSTLKKGELKRMFLGFEILDKSLNIHEWEKTNLITKYDGINFYDIYQCSNCGITGKRYGINNNILRDKKYKHEKHNFCKLNFNLTYKKITELNKEFERLYLQQKFDDANDILIRIENALDEKQKRNKDNGKSISKSLSKWLDIISIHRYNMNSKLKIKKDKGV